MGYTIRTNDSRYTEGRNFKTGSLVAIELYDQARDPDETITRPIKFNTKMISHL